MEEYREKLKMQNLLIAVGCAIVTLFGVFAIANEQGLIHVMPAAGDSHTASMWNGFIFGVAIGFLAMQIVSLVKNIRALKDEKKLKKHFVRENDERQAKIWTSARASAMKASLLLGLPVGIVAGYFNMTVGITIFACMTAFSFIGLGFKLYYSRKF